MDHPLLPEMFPARKISTVYVQGRGYKCLLQIYPMGYSCTVEVMVLNQQADHRGYKPQPVDTIRQIRAFRPTKAIEDQAKFQVWV